MKTSTAKTYDFSFLLSVLLKSAAALVFGFLLFFVLISAVGIGYDMAYRGRIFPGVSVAGVDLSGMQPVQAAVKLAQEISYPQTGKIVFQDKNSTWQTTPADLGLNVDLEESIRAAYRLGRQGSPLHRVGDQLQAWHSGRELPTVLNYNEVAAMAYLEGIAAQVNRPVKEATLTLNGVEVNETAGQIGREVDIPATLAPLESNLGALLDGLFTLVVKETPPEILEAKAAAEQARKIINAPLVLTVPNAQNGDAGPWKVEPTQLATLLVIERVDGENGGQFVIRLDVEKLRPLLEEAAGKLTRTPVNARFIFNDETRKLDLLQPSTTGRSLNIDATLEAIQNGLPAGNHEQALVLDLAQPAVPSEATAEQLGIKELVSVHTSFFYGSSAPRIQNIQTAAANFHGLLVPPGATFSMAENMADVTLDNGYAEALIIFGDRTITGVGGGVCQVSTTLFRTAFLAGFPIVERNPHAYRVGYYEQTASGGHDPDLAGLDATVFVPVVDLKFVNDTPNWLLMETYVNVKARKITWKFYSTSDGRKVEWETSGLQNIVDPPEPQYIENPKLDEGEIKQVDWAVEGADVTVIRVVYRDGEVYFRDKFITHYQPWQAVYEYGPGTEIP
jgi:vancomycin resistance protein YoaR